MSTGLCVPSGETPFGIDPEYPIADRHTVYEWAMALGADKHPYSHDIESLYGPHGLLRATSIEGKKARKAAVKGWPSKTEPEERLGPRDIYLTLKSESDAGRLVPLCQEWCVPRPGIDPSNVRDFTRCVFDIKQIWPLIERRDDTGQLIEEMRAAFNGTGAAKVLVPDATQVDPIAEWIYEQHPQDGRPKSKNELLRAAMKARLEFTARKFNEAYRSVYETKPNRPPLSGWPLKEPYRSRKK